MERKQFKQGDVIFREGEFGSAMYEVCSGTVGIFVKYGESEEKKLTELGEKRIFGEMGIIEVSPRSATAVALSDVEVDEITVAELKEYFERSPERLIEIMRGQSRRLRELTEDYNAVCAMIAKWKEEDGKGNGKKSSGLLSGLKKFAAIFAESARSVGNAGAGLFEFDSRIFLI